MASNKLWDEPGLVDALIEAVKKGHSNVDVAVRLSKDFKVLITPNAVSGKINRLKNAGVAVKNRAAIRLTSPSVKEGVIQDIKNGYSTEAAGKRNGVSKSYCRLKRKELIVASEFVETIVRRPPSRRVLIAPAPRPDVAKTSKPAAFAAVIIPFEPPARRQPSSVKTCEFLLNDKRPWLCCTEPTVYHTSWCNEHGKKCFIVWPPKNYQTEGQKYG